MAQPRNSTSLGLQLVRDALLIRSGRVGGVGGQPDGQGFQLLQRQGLDLISGDGCDASSGLEIAKNFLRQNLVDLTVPRNGLGATGLRLVKNVMSAAMAQKNATGLLQFSD